MEKAVTLIACLAASRLLVDGEYVYPGQATALPEKDYEEQLALGNIVEAPHAQDVMEAARQAEADRIAAEQAAAEEAAKAEAERLAAEQAADDEAAKAEAAASDKPARKRG